MMISGIVLRQTLLENEKRLRTQRGKAYPSVILLYYTNMIMSIIVHEHYKCIFITIN